MSEFEPGTRVAFPVRRGGGTVTYARGVVVPGPPYAITFRMVRVIDTGGTPAVIEVRLNDLTPEGQHVNYPHEPGRLYDCPACEAGCHCGPAVARGEETECIWDGHES